MGDDFVTREEVRTYYTFLLTPNVSKFLNIWDHDYYQVPLRNNKKKITPKYVDDSDSDFETPIEIKKRKEFKCEKCSYVARDNYNLRKHILTHPTELESKGSLNCPQQSCQYLASRFEHMDRHIHIVHGRNIEIDQLTLNSDTDLKQWMQTLQEKEFAKYRLQWRKAGKVRVFYCHRSSMFKKVSKSNRKRSLKNKAQ
jgi:hypothetical protein